MTLLIPCDNVGLPVADCAAAEACQRAPTQCLNECKCAVLMPSWTPVYPQSALRLKPAFTDAWNNIASALVQKGLIPQAIDCYAAALRINPRLVSQQHCRL